ncbi:MAG: hypothetical protein ACNA7V_14285 [Bacteroidales bacterium]
MKKFATIALVALMTAGTLILTYCSKEKSFEPVANQNAHEQMTEADFAVMNKLVAFRDKVQYFRENPGYKSGEVLTIDSVKWYLDAFFNFTYAFTMETFTSFKTYTFLTVINQNAGLVNLEDVFSALNDIKAKTLIIYDSTLGDQKELYALSMDMTSNTSDSFVIKTTATIGSKTSTPPEISEWGPFTVGNDWMYGELLGDCSPGGGLWWYIKDAATEIKDASNTFRYKYIQDEGSGWTAYYTEPSAIATVTIYLSSTEVKNLLRTPGDGAIDNDRDYLVLYQEKDLQNGLIVETCIPWQDMNFYYHGARKVIYEIVQENYSIFGVDPNLTFYYCNEILGKREGGDDYNPNIAYHIIEALYKTRHISYFRPISIND